jgi:integrase
MANTKYHHLTKRGQFWYFRKGKTRISLETTIATEAIRLRDRMLENYRINGSFTATPESQECPTFGQVAKEWAAIHEGRVKYSTWRDYRSSMNKHVLPFFKDMPIEAISYLDVEKFIASLTCGPKRTNNILVPMRSVFKMAFKHGYVQDNVMLKVDNRTVEQPDIFPFSYEEVLLILNAIDPFYRPYTVVRFFTGMRSGEIDALLWSDFKQSMKPRPKIHIHKSYVYGQDDRPKTKKSKRYVDCIDLVLEALEDQRKLTGKSQHIFLTQGEARMNPDHYRNVVWTKALDKTGLKYRPPIQTRHTFATLMLSAGEDIGWVQSMMGHSSLQMTFTRYYAWIPRKTRNDGAAFMQSIGQKKPEDGDREDVVTGAKVIPLFQKVSQLRHTPIKKGLGEKP